MDIGSGIYKIVNRLNNHYYIGSAADLRVRKNNHFSQLQRDVHHSIHLQRAWHKYGGENFVFEVIEYCETNDLIDREQYWIDSLKPEYNISRIAGSPLGVKHTEQSRLNMSKGRMGLCPSEETKRKMSESHKGKVSKESIQNLIDNARRKRAATHCKRGHLFDEKNTYWFRGLRRCKKCHNMQNKKYRQTIKHKRGTK